jgi:hypothetical protein
LAGDDPEKQSPMMALTRSTPTTGWRTQARCRGIDPEIVYPEKVGVWGGLDVRERRRLIRQRRRSA